MKTNKDFKLDYPILKPLPIKTRNKKWYKQLKIWLVESRKWEVVEDYYLYVPWLNETIKIPKGFVFDGASIPKLFWPLLSPTGLLFIPGLIHDYGYAFNNILNANDEIIEGAHGKKYFDKLFAKLGSYINNMKVIDYTAYYALYLFGFVAWRNHRKAHFNKRIKRREV